MECGVMRNQRVVNNLHLAGDDLPERPMAPVDHFGNAGAGDAHAGLRDLVCADPCLPANIIDYHLEGFSGGVLANFADLDRTARSTCQSALFIAEYTFRLGATCINP